MSQLGMPFPLIDHCHINIVAAKLLVHKFRIALAQPIRMLYIVEHREARAGSVVA